MGAAALIVLSTGVAAEGRTLTGDDYARAERYVGYNVTPLVDHAVQTVTWLDDTHFWYRDHDASGDRFMRFDVDTGKAEPAFDHARLATALGKVLGKTTSAGKLGITTFTTAADGRLDLNLHGKHYLCDMKGNVVCVVGRDESVDGIGNEPGVLSPDKRSEAFIRNWNLWVRELATAWRTTATPPTTQAGSTPTRPSWCGRPIPSASPRSSRISARPATW
jgi:hypothetical protein